MNKKVILSLSLSQPPSLHVLFHLWMLENGEIEISLLLYLLSLIDYMRESRYGELFFCLGMEKL